MPLFQRMRTILHHKRNLVNSIILMLICWPVISGLPGRGVLLFLDPFASVWHQALPAGDGEEVAKRDAATEGVGAYQQEAFEMLVEKPCTPWVVYQAPERDLDLLWVLQLQGHSSKVAESTCSQQRVFLGGYVTDVIVVNRSLDHRLDYGRGDCAKTRSRISKRSWSLMCLLI